VDQHSPKLNFSHTNVALNTKFNRNPSKNFGNDAYGKTEAKHEQCETNTSFCVGSVTTLPVCYPILHTSVDWRQMTADFNAQFPAPVVMQKFVAQL